MPKSILVVDDDPSIARMYATALGQIGEVTTAGSGTEAVSILSVKAFDAVILDIRMPGLGGLDVLDKCFPKGHAGTAVFVVTADQTDEIRSAAMKPEPSSSSRSRSPSKCWWIRCVPSWNGESQPSPDT